jgi:hypothetical protein
MNAIGLIAVALFGVGWLGGVIAWFYAAYHLIPSKFRIEDPHIGSSLRVGPRLSFAGYLHFPMGSSAAGSVDGTFL